MRSQDRLLERDGVNSAGEGIAAARPPTFSGNLRSGQTLTGVNGSFNGSPTISVARAWLRNGTPISGATGATYELVDADQGARISFRNIATNSFGSVISISLRSATVVGFPTVNAVPTVSGTRTVGETLTRVAGTFFGKATITVTGQWLRNGVAIEGATGATYELVEADEGAFVTHQSTGTNEYGAVTSVSANGTAIAGA
jgi:hypothetical protein